MPENPYATLNEAQEKDRSVRFEDVLRKEHEQIIAVRKLREVPNPDRWGKIRTEVDEPHPMPTPILQPHLEKEPKWQEQRPPWDDWLAVISKAHEMNLVGLSLSGGGIRSATFNLGVLQALADLKLLHRIDYLSTVSGGGYIGSWLAAWIKRKGSFGKVQQLLSTNRVHLDDDFESMPVRFLRTYSNYLTPRLGLFGGDTLAMVAIYLRNLLLNQAVIIGLFATLLLLPQTILRVVEHLLSLPGIGYVLESFELCLLLVATYFVAVNMERLSQGLLRAEAERTKQKYVLWSVIVPFGIVSVAASLHLHAAASPLVWGRKVPLWAFGAAGYSVLWLFGLGIIDVRTVCRSAVRSSPKSGRAFERLVKLVLVAPVIGAVAGWLYGILADQAGWSAKSALTFGAPLVVGIALLAATLHIGLHGTDFQDERREWWGRLSGLMLALGVGWVALFWVVLYFPGFLQFNQSTFLRRTVQDLATKYLTPAWILITLGSVWVGNSKASGKPGEKTTTQKYLDLMAKVGPYVFIVGLVCWMSWGLNRAPFNHGNVYVKFVTCFVVTCLMSWRVDINQFSMQMFYRNRLVGCYLGATNKRRRPNRFTGIDPKDDVPLIDFQNPSHPASNSTGQAGYDSKGYDGPYPIINMSMNLVKGKDLAWQERKAESFVMTPHFCGFDVFLEQQYGKMQSDEFKRASKGASEHKKRIDGLDLFGYRPTDEYAFPCDARGEPGYHGPNLGLAMAISGAAASPNMGYYTTTAVAFLLTVFNVRLGQWLGNPRNPKTSRLPTPTFGLDCLLQELFAGTNDESEYVYLSDGGHFDNMGLYELVKRRCGLIIVCDAEADPHYGFAGLGDAIKKCRIDLGIDIDIDTKPIVPNKSGVSKQHYAIGKIHYGQADVKSPVGKIIYIKSSLTGKEPADVTTYKKRHSAFPHEDTANQWFTESQFESYRRLGYEAVYSSVCFPDQNPEGAAPQSRLFSDDFRPIFNEFGFFDTKTPPKDRSNCSEGV